MHHLPPHDDKRLDIHAAIFRLVNNELAEYERVRNGSRSVILDLNDKLNSAARDPNSHTTRTSSITTIEMALDQAVKTKKYETFIATLAAEIITIKKLDSELRKTLISILEQLAPIFQQDKNHAHSAKEAYRHIYHFLNERLASEFKKYKEWKTAGLSPVYAVKNGPIKTAEEMLSSNYSYRQRRECVQWAEYILQALGQCESAEDYLALLADMQIILHKPVLREDILKEHILTCCREIRAQLFDRRKNPYLTEGMHELDVAITGMMQRRNISASQPAAVFSLSHKANLFIESSHARLKKWVEYSRVVRDREKLWKFYNEIQKLIAAKLIATKMFNSGLVPLPQGRKAGVGNMLAFVVQEVPLFGAGLASRTIQVIAQGADQSNRQREFNNADVTEINMIDLFAQKLAGRITLRYCEQVKAIGMPSVELLAKCAAERVFEILKSGRLQEILASVGCEVTEDRCISKIIEEISNTNMRHGLRIPLLDLTIGNQDLLVSNCKFTDPLQHNGQEWTAEGALSKAGIVVIVDGQLEYFYNPHDPDGPGGRNSIQQYGYMLGTYEEVLAWKMVPVPREMLPTTPHTARELSKSRGGDDRQTVMTVASMSIGHAASHCTSDGGGANIAIGINVTS